MGYHSYRARLSVPAVKSLLNLKTRSCSHCILNWLCTYVCSEKFHIQIMWLYLYQSYQIRWFLVFIPSMYHKDIFDCNNHNNTNKFLFSNIYSDYKWIWARLLLRLFFSVKNIRKLSKWLIIELFLSCCFHFRYGRKNWITNWIKR